MVHESGMSEGEKISKGYLLDSSEGEKVKHIRYRKEEVFDASIRLRKHVSYENRSYVRLRLTHGSAHCNVSCYG